MNFWLALSYRENSLRFLECSGTLDFFLCSLVMCARGLKSNLDKQICAKKLATCAVATIKFMYHYTQVCAYY